MKSYGNKFIIGVDHGYGNIKTANHCFKTGITSYDTEPLFTKDMLIYNGKYYLIGEGHKEFLRDKVQDNDYYCLTLVAIAMELSDVNIYEADVLQYPFLRCKDLPAGLFRNPSVHAPNEGAERDGGYRQRHHEYDVFGERQTESGKQDVYREIRRISMHACGPRGIFQADAA